MEIAENQGNSVNVSGTSVTQHRVLKNTHLLLSMTPLFSVVTALTTATLKLSHPGLLISLGGYFGPLSRYLWRSSICLPACCTF